MIFAFSKVGDALFLFFTEQDVVNMREGRTTFVDQRQLKGLTFKQVIAGVVPNDQAALDLLKKGDIAHDAIIRPEPGKGEERCTGCDGLIATQLMFEGKCNICWATLAKKLQTQRN